MLKNVGNIDRIIRVAAAALFAWLYSSGTVAGTFGTVLMVLSLVFLITGMVGYCPLYHVLGLSTCPIDTKKSGE